MKYLSIYHLIWGLVFLLFISTNLNASNKGVIQFFGSVVNETCQYAYRNNQLSSTCYINGKYKQHYQSIKTGQTKLHSHYPQIKSITMAWLHNNKTKVVVVTLHYN